MNLNSFGHPVMSNEKLKIAVSYHFTLLSKCITKTIKKLTENMSNSMPLE